MTSSRLNRSTIAALASQAGLALAGITTAEPLERARRYTVAHVEAGHTAGMDWFTTHRAEEASRPQTLQENVRSIISLGLPFWSGKQEAPDDGVLRGRIARYAWGRDYHKTMKRRIKQLITLLEEHLQREIEHRALVDTARAMDRALAERAGVGWFGKNSMIIVPGHGSWVMLGEIYLDVDIAPDLPLNQDCGRCSICIDHCPTGAIVEPYRVHAPRCISYLTIEERGSIDPAIRASMGNWVFGCDVCQDVCPYTKAAKPADDLDFAPATVDNAFPSLERLVTQTEDEFYDLYRGTAVIRAKRRGLARNAAIALGNSGDERAIPILTSVLNEHDEPLVRGHAAWALQHLIGAPSKRTLERARAREGDPTVIEEIDMALTQIRLG